MADLDELLGQIPVDQIAGRLGIDQAEASGAVQQALPGLLAGLQHNVDSGAQGGAGGLLSALQGHAGTGLLDGGVNVDDVDVADGEKIVSKAFDGQPDAAAAHLAGSGGGDVVKKVLPYLAPIVMAFLAKKLTSGGSGAQGTASATSDDGGGLGGLLGGLLGGSSSGGGLGGILGGLFGGK
jgi:hypothetical protein